MSLQKSDRLVDVSLLVCAVLSTAIVVFIVLFVAWEASGSFVDPGVLSFVMDPSWHPTYSSYNLLPMLVGTLVIAAGALVVAAPLGLLSAIYLQFYCQGWLRSLVYRVLGLLAGVPSVVFGLWGLTVLVPKIAVIQQPGASVLAGIVILSMMVLPTMALSADAVLSQVSSELLLAAKGLGFSKFGLVFSVAIPSAKAGLATGFVLQLGRALGETMAVLMVTGNVVQFPNSLFDPVRVLTSNVALEMAYAMEGHRSALFFTGLILVVLIYALVFLSNRYFGGTHEG